MTPDALAAAWRDRAAELRRYGAEPQAVTLEAAADELDASLRAAADTALTLTEAARESGYAPRTLRQMVAEGRLPNAGRRNAPRIRRADLPRRAGRNGGAFNAAEAARGLR
jgi:hypothetical protein